MLFSALITTHTNPTRFLLHDLDKQTIDHVATNPNQSMSLTKRNETSPEIVLHMRPKQPLRPLNLEIVQQAKQMNLSWADLPSELRGNHSLAARGDPHDETAFYFKDTFVPKMHANKTHCFLQDSDYKVMTEQVQLQQGWNHSSSSTQFKHRSIKIFCIVYTIEKNHPRLTDILKTWGYVHGCKNNDCVARAWYGLTRCSFLFVIISQVKVWWIHGSIYKNWSVGWRPLHPSWRGRTLYVLRWLKKKRVVLAILQKMYWSVWYSLTSYTFCKLFHHRR